MSIILFQTADPIHYREMLEATARTVTEFCRRHGHAYESYVGIKRGPRAWQASFNRIYQYQELIERGHRGWAVHLDADAYVNDLDFDLSGYLADKTDRAAILVPMGAGDPWNINSGVSLINLGHPFGRALVVRWMAAFMQLSDQWLAETAHWPDDANDQYMLYCILRDDPELRDAIHFESPALINSDHARFIRQKLRAYIPDQKERTRAIRLLVDEMLGAEGETATDRLAPIVVTAAYRAVLHRDPDAEGLANFAAHIRSRGLERGVADMLGGMLESEEYRSRTGR